VVQLGIFCNEASIVLTIRVPDTSLLDSWRDFILWFALDLIPAFEKKRSFSKFEIPCDSPISNDCLLTGDNIVVLGQVTIKQFFNPMKSCSS